MSTTITLRSEPTDEPRPWLAHYPEFVPAHLEYPRRPIWWLLDQAAAKHPERVACQYYQQELTYSQLLEQARRAGACLRRRGIGPGDRVGILLPNMPEYLIAAYGVWMAGGTVLSLSPLLVAAEISGLIEQTGCRLVVSLDVLTPLVLQGKVRPETVLVATIQDRLAGWQWLGYGLHRLRTTGLRRKPVDTKIYSFADELVPSDSAFAAAQPSGDEPAYILPTGGTTGQPKAVVLTHANLMANAWQLLHWMPPRIGQESLLAVAPFFHSFGLSSCVTTGVAASATLILFHRFRAERVARLIRQHRPTCFPAVPSMLYALNEQWRDKPSQPDLLKVCISGGAPLDAAIAEEFAEHTGAVVVEGYGLSEASPVTHVGPLDGNARAGTIGLPLPDTDARIVDAQTGRLVLPPGEVGELVVRGPQVMQGYWKRPEETERTIRDGWLYTGDLAMRDEGGFFRIVDRKKDLIITSGLNVYPSDVEQVLRDFPGVVDAAVVGVPDRERGELVKAILVVDKKNSFSRSAFDQFAQRHLAHHKRPRLVEVVEGDLPRNYLGKLERRKLREGYGQARRAG